jgi:hypothetical protein
MTPAEEAEPTRRGRDLLGWLFIAAAVLYAFAIHHGIGPAPAGIELAWYEPRGYIAGWGWLGWAFESPRRLILVLALPAVALTVAAFLTGRSAVGRALALSCVVAVILFAFYGEAAVRVWQFFHWRGSAVLALTALVVGSALAAPLLAESWMRLRWPLRLVAYIPVCLIVIAFIRNATGTDPSLRFAISPWPAVPVFGIEVGSLFVMLWLAGVAFGVGGIARARGREGASRVGVIVAGLVLALGLPLALLALGSALSLLPFKAGRGTLGAVGVACALGVGIAAALGTRGRADALRARAVHFAVGAALIGIPLVSGQAWARWDYYLSREHRAREIIDALAAYYEQEEIYPDELEELLASNHLERIPEPTIGFGVLYDGRFRYRSFGTSYLLEFPAPRWVECAYTPPYEDEDEDYDDEADDLGEGEGLDESWSCPSKPPELW